MESQEGRKKIVMGQQCSLAWIARHREQWGFKRSLELTAHAAGFSLLLLEDSLVFSSRTIGSGIDDVSYCACVCWKTRPTVLLLDWGLVVRAIAEESTGFCKNLFGALSHLGRRQYGTGLLDLHEFLKVKVSFTLQMLH